MSVDRVRSAEELHGEAEKLRRRVAELEEVVRSRSEAESLLLCQRDLAMALNAATDLSDVFNHVIEAAARICAIDCGGMYLVDNASGNLDLVTYTGLTESFAAQVRHFAPDTPQGRMAHQGRPLYTHVDEIAPSLPANLRYEGVRFLASVPVRHEGQLRAVLNLASHQVDHLPPAQRRALEAIVSQVEPVMVRIVAEAEAQRERVLLRRLLDLHERDRQLLAYEIHDGFAQQLTAALLNLESYEDLRKQNEEEAQRALARAVEIVRESLKETRRLITGLRPPILDESGIVTAIEYLAFEMQRQFGLLVSFSRQVSFTRLAAPIENALFRVAQEALNNAARHSGSDRVQVSLTEADDRVRLEIRDDGKGFNPAAVEEGRFGLQGMRERARLLNGSALIQSAPGRGTQISIELPLMPARPEAGSACGPD